MRVTVSGASGLIGSALVARLAERGAQVTILTRDPEHARARLDERVQALVRWEPSAGPAPARALAGRDAVVSLAGENIAQRWSPRAKRAIRESRLAGTGNLVAGLSQLDRDERPRVLVSASAVGYYGPRGAEPIDEEAPPGKGFLAELCLAWEREARAAEQLGVRTVLLRTGVVLDRAGGALAKMLGPFRLGLGGPVAGGSQYVAWVHRDDVTGMILSALGDERWTGAFNLTAPEPVTNRELSRALGRALHRPAVLPVAGAALALLYGEMAEILTTGVRAVPARALMLGYEFLQPRLTEALRAALSG